MKAWIVQFLCAVALLASASAPQENLPVKEPDVSAILRIEPRSLDFGSRPVGTSSAPMTTTLGNDGKAAIKLMDITTSGIDFQQTNTCGEVILPGSSCQIHVVFTPAITGTRLGVLGLIVSSPGTPFYIALTGVGR